MTGGHLQAQDGAATTTPAAPAPPSEAEPQAGTSPSVIPAPPAVIEPADVFGDSVDVPARTIVYLKGKGNLESDYPTLQKAFETVENYVKEAGLTPAGHPLLIYREGGDTGFEFQAAVPIAEAPASAPAAPLALGETPQGKMLKFVHQGAYNAMDMTYEAITNFLDEKGLDADELFIEEYVSDPVATSPDKLVINILVPAH